MLSGEALIQVVLCFRENNDMFPYKPSARLLKVGGLFMLSLLVLRFTWQIKNGKMK